MSNTPVMTMKIKLPLDPQPTRWDVGLWMWGRSVLTEAELAQRVFDEHLGTSPIGKPYGVEMLHLGVDFASVGIDFQITAAWLSPEDGVWFWFVNAEAEVQP